MLWWLGPGRRLTLWIVWHANLLSVVVSNGTHQLSADCLSGQRRVGGRVDVTMHPAREQHPGESEQVIDGRDQAGPEAGVVHGGRLEHGRGQYVRSEEHTSELQS